MTAPRKYPAPWLFMLTCIPYGAAGTFTGGVMPYLTRQAGIKVESIGWFSFLLFVPTWMQFLYAPIIDLGPTRRQWLVMLSVGAAACYMGACVVPLPDQKELFLGLAFAGQLLTGLVGACNGGLMASTLPDEVRGRAGAYYNIGNLSGGAIAGYVVIQMTGEVEPIVVGAVLAAMMILPALAVLKIVEPPREKQTAVFRTMLKSVGNVLFSKHGATGILLCVSPVGTAALLNYFSSFGPDYHVSKGWLAFVNGPANAVLSAVGALAGGYLCDRYNRRANYLVSGALTALCGLVMAAFPHTQATYVMFVALYYLIAGYCYAAFTATVLETIGETTMAASMQYSMFTAAGNLAIAYVGKVNTVFYDTHEVNGVETGNVDAVLTSDALLNLGGVVVLALLFWRLGLFRRKAPAT